MKPICVVVLLALLVPAVAAETLDDPEGDASRPSADIRIVIVDVTPDWLFINVTMQGEVDSLGAVNQCFVAINPGAADEGRYGVALLFNQFGANHYVNGTPEATSSNQSTFSGSKIRFAVDRNETATKRSLDVDCRTQREALEDVAAKTFGVIAPSASDAPASPAPTKSGAHETIVADGETGDINRSMAIGEGGEAPGPGVALLLLVAALLVVGRRRKAA